MMVRNLILIILGFLCIAAVHKVSAIIGFESTVLLFLGILLAYNIERSARK